jgi:hypothetical protein
VLLILFTGCEKKHDDDTTDDVLVPLKNGNIWVYQEASYFEGTILTAETLSISIDMDTIIEASPVFIWNQSNQEYVFFYFNSSDGLYEKARKRKGTDSLLIWTNPVMLFKFPAERGETFTSYGSTTTVLKTDTLISTPAGDFNCYCFSSFQSPFLFKYLFSPNVGYIGRTRFYYDMMDNDRKLISYTISSDL